MNGVRKKIRKASQCPIMDLGSLATKSMVVDRREEKTIPSQIKEKKTRLFCYDENQGSPEADRELLRSIACMTEKLKATLLSTSSGLDKFRCSQCQHRPSNLHDLEDELLCKRCGAKSRFCEVCEAPFLCEAEEARCALHRDSHCSNCKRPCLHKLESSPMIQCSLCSSLHVLCFSCGVVIQRTECQKSQQTSRQVCTKCADPKYNQRRRRSRP
mmetsp:Transcript_29758/g.41492  ORF Transcript_29758/g.41492 Transcript_29758/m.41492 type:complete len:214 (+) Transcript_29758:92-733(+)